VLGGAVKAGPALRGALAAAWATMDARDAFWFGGLALFAFASSWRLAAVGAALALHALFGPVLVAWAAKVGAK
jgi:hypothetical protein